MAKKPDKIEPIDAIAEAMVRPTSEINESNALVVSSGDLVPPPPQGELFHVEKQAEVNGIEMGVLDDVTPSFPPAGIRAEPRFCA